MFKKGELTTQQIVGLIVLIASFSVLLYFLFSLGLGSETDSQLCRNSVIQRGVSPLPSEGTSLQCRTSYVCFSEDGSCESLTNPVIKKVKSKEEVYEVLADELASCWWMFGEGKVNYVGSDLLPELYCSICSQMAFDDSLKGDIFPEGSFNQRTFYNFLENTPFKDDLSYAEYLQGSGDLGELHKNNFENINLDKQYYIIMGTHSDISTLGWAVIGGVTAIGIVASPIVGVGWGAGAIALTLSGVGGGTAIGGGAYYVGTILEGESGLDYLRPTIVEVNSESFKGLHCGEIVTLA